MVVRQIVEVDPGAASKTLILNPAECEKAAAQYLENFEKKHGFTFKEKRTAIDRTKLSLVFFVQDKETKKIYNAAVAAVK